LEKKNPTGFQPCWFSALLVLIKINSPGFQQQFSQAGFQIFKNWIFLII
jgi:hypothetical protein